MSKEQPTEVEINQWEKEAEKLYPDPKKENYVNYGVHNSGGFYFNDCSKVVHQRTAYIEGCKFTYASLQQRVQELEKEKEAWNRIVYPTEFNYTERHNSDIYTHHARFVAWARIKIYEQAERLQQLEGEKWISVEMRLPEESGRTLVYTEDGYVWYLPFELMVGAWETDYVFPFENEVITHWMPLPAPPSAQLEGEKWIKKGDEYFTVKGGCFECKDVTEGDGSLYFPKETLIWHWEEGNGNIRTWNPLSECFKIKNVDLHTAVKGFTEIISELRRQAEFSNSVCSKMELTENPPSAQLEQKCTECGGQGAVVVGPDIHKDIEECEICRGTGLEQGKEGETCACDFRKGDTAADGWKCMACGKTIANKKEETGAADNNSENKKPI